MMNDFAIPDSVRDYIMNRKVKMAVDSLIPILGGTEMPAVENRDDARSLNQAIFMAAHVRRDYVEMNFQLWESIFGEPCKNHGFIPEFESNHFSLDHIWTEGEIACTISRKQKGAPRYELWHLICPDEDGSIELYLQANKTDSELYSTSLVSTDIGLAPSSVWEETELDAASAMICLIAGSTKVEDFLSNPQEYISVARAAAEELIDAISRTP